MNDKNPNAGSAARPDNGLFKWLMGVFFLCLAAAPVYWAFYNYERQQQTEDLLRRWSQQPESIPKDSYGGDPFVIQKSRAERYRLEMILSATGGVLLFGIALLLFGRALAARQARVEYAPIDWRATSPPPQAVEVREKKIYDGLFALIAVFFGGMALLIAYQTFSSQFETGNGKIIKGVLFPACLLLILSLIAFLQFRAKRRAVRRFDASGIVRGDGRRFSWNEFCGVVTRIDFNRRTQTRYVWRVELAFGGGEAAWIIPNRIKNAEEVFAYLAALPPASIKN